MRSWTEACSPRLAIAAAAALAFCGPLSAQTPTARVRGTIESVEPARVVVRTREGDAMPIALKAPVTVSQRVQATSSAIGPKSFVGVAAAPGPDKTLRAIEIFVFPKSMRGTGEGHRPFDLMPESTMTNATLADTVETTRQGDEADLQGRRADDPADAQHEGLHLCGRLRRTTSSPGGASPPPSSSCRTEARRPPGLRWTRPEQVSALPGPGELALRHGDGPASRKRRPAAAWRPRAAMARAAHDAARRGDQRGDRPALRPRRAAAPPRASVLVPVVRRRDGHGLALLRHHHQRHRRAEARADAAVEASSASMSAAAAAATRARRRTSSSRSASASASTAPRSRRQPPGRQGRQRRRAGRLRALPARLHRHRRRPLGRRPAGHERRRRSRRGAITGCRRGSTSFVEEPHAAIEGAEPGRDRQSHRPARGGLARAPARAARHRSGPTASCARWRRSKARRPPRSEPRTAAACRISSCRRTTTCAPRTWSLRRLHGDPRRGGRSRPDRFRRAAADAGRRRAHRAGAGAWWPRSCTARPTASADPARFSLAHGGKDGHPFPVPLKVYDETIRVLKSARREGEARPRRGARRLAAPRRSGAQAGRVIDGPSLDEFIGKERASSAAWGGRTVFDDPAG